MKIVLISGGSFLEMSDKQTGENLLPVITKMIPQFSKKSS